MIYDSRIYSAIYKSFSELSGLLDRKSPFLSSNKHSRIIKHVAIHPKRIQTSRDSDTNPLTVL
jgi:hypothetical protein